MRKAALHSILLGCAAQMVLPVSLHCPPTIHTLHAQERDPRQLRKALQLLTYIAQEDPRQVSEVMKRRGLLPALRHCLGSGDQDVRQWALGLMAATSHSSSGMRQLHQVCSLLCPLHTTLVLQAA